VIGQQTVFIVGDDAANREWIAGRARARGVDVGEFTSAEQFLAAYDSSAAGCIVAEIDFADTSGIEFLAQVDSRDIPLPVIVLSVHADVPTAVRMMQAGANTLLQKPCEDDVLWRAVEAALEQERERRPVWQERRQIRTRLATLSMGEMDVMMGLLAGNPNKRIATELGVGLRTVELRRARLLKKMQAGSLAEMVRMATIVDISPRAADEPHRDA
jgi:two-component system response regulator FixJ